YELIARRTSGPSKQCEPLRERSALHRRWIVGTNGRQRAGPALDLYERVLARTALGESRSSPVERQDVRIAVDAHRAEVRRVEGVVPGARRQLDDAGPHGVAHHRAGQTAAAVVEDSDDVPALHAARGGVGRVKADRLAPADLRGLAVGADV